MKIINTEILSHPLNWITVAIWLFAIGMLFTAAGLSHYPQQDDTNKAATKG